jgi:hypothetical protein
VIERAPRRASESTYPPLRLRVRKPDSAVSLYDPPRFTARRSRWPVPWAPLRGPATGQTAAVLRRKTQPGGRFPRRTDSPAQIGLAIIGGSVSGNCAACRPPWATRGRPVPVPRIRIRALMIAAAVLVPKRWGEPDA